MTNATAKACLNGGTAHTERKGSSELKRTKKFLKKDDGVEVVANVEANARQSN
ncbi:MAG: hypothetical protein J6C93_05190 [Clostridia bacterium]|nr:hypothetical protein [Clostridia bacterium]